MPLAHRGHPALEAKAATSYVYLDTATTPNLLVLRTRTRRPMKVRPTTTHTRVPACGTQRVEPIWGPRPTGPRKWGSWRLSNLLSRSRGSEIFTSCLMGFSGWVDGHSCCRVYLGRLVYVGPFLSSVFVGRRHSFSLSSWLL